MLSPALAFTLLAVLAGTLFPIQTAVNAKLASAVGGPVIATVISFASGFGALLIVNAVVTRQWPPLEVFRQQPPWLFVAGGLLGATYLCLNVLLVPRIGTGAAMALAVAGQMIAALVLDSRGLFGLATRELSIGRVIGAICVVLGAAMVRLL